MCLILSPVERYWNMELKIIKTKKQYEQFLDWVDVQFENKVKANTSKGE
jgi:HTH-type transcriptional regulator/antitoxin HigA